MSARAKTFLEETLGALGLAEDAAVAFEPIDKGGSDRTFQRVVVGGRAVAILMHYGTDREENRLFVGIGRYLEGIGVPVPRILACDEGRRLVWLEDLGSTDLHSVAGGSWEVRAPFYGRVLEAISVLHGRDPREPSALGLGLSPGFDARLYHWEHEYFLENFVERVCGIPASEARTGVEGECRSIAAELLGAPAALIHRDFQSQNIMVREGSVGFVDFQGMRIGTAYYDLASLLFDPYVPMAVGHRDEMLRLYHGLGGVGGVPWEVFHRLVQVAGCQRLMQALGAYGFLSLVKGRAAFLAHLPRGLERLAEAVEGAGPLPGMSSLVGRCAEALAARGSGRNDR